MSTMSFVSSASVSTSGSMTDIIFAPNYPPVDGYICGLSSESKDVSTILSKYFGKPVHLVFKGPRPRSIDPTVSFPDLVATARYQDNFPVLILSEESTEVIENEMQNQLNERNIDQRWKTDSIVIER